MVIFDLHSRHGVSTAATFDQVSRHLPGQAGLHLKNARSKQRKKLENVFCIQLDSNISIWFNMSIVCILSLEACIRQRLLESIVFSNLRLQCQASRARRADLSQAARKIETRQARWKNFGNRKDWFGSQKLVWRNSMSTKQLAKPKECEHVQNHEENRNWSSISACVWYWCVVQSGKWYPETPWFYVVFMHARRLFQLPSLSPLCGFTERCRCRNNPDAVWATVR